MGKYVKNGVADIAYIEADCFKTIDIFFLRPENPLHPEFAFKAWEIDCERDEDGMPVVKHGYVKAYINGLCLHLGKDSPKARIVFKLKCEENEFYWKEQIDIPRDKIKIFPIGKDEKFIFQKWAPGVEILSSEIW